MINNDKSTNESTEQIFSFTLLPCGNHCTDLCSNLFISDKALPCTIPHHALRLMNRDYTSLFVLISDHVGVLCTNKHKDSSMGQ